MTKKFATIDQEIKAFFQSEEHKAANALKRKREKEAAECSKEKDRA